MMKGLFIKIQNSLSSDDEREEREEDESKNPAEKVEEPQKLNLSQRSVTNDDRSPSIVQENFSVTELLSAWEHKEQERSDVQPAHSLNTMISRTETAISEVEATMENAEAELGKALDHTEKVINQSRQQISSESTT